MCGDHYVGIDYMYLLCNGIYICLKKKYIETRINTPIKNECHETILMALRQASKQCYQANLAGIHQCSQQFGVKIGREAESRTTESFLRRSQEKAK